MGITSTKVRWWDGVVSGKYRHSQAGLSYGWLVACTYNRKMEHLSS